MKKLLVVQAAALSYDAARALDVAIEFRPGQSVFPAVTCPVQASFRTAALPDRHGMVANGLYDRAYRKARFWEQSASLVAGPRIWREFRRSGGTVALLFWQQSMGEEADIILTPAPIHKHHGGMIEDCYARPEGLYARLCRRIGRPFRLRHYWGPTASYKAGGWIAAATAEVLADPDLAPDLCLTYLPTLDYDFQRFGPAHPRSRRALEQLERQLALLLAAAEQRRYETVVFGDYAIVECAGVVFPNRILRDAGLMKTRSVNGRRYADFHASRAFAVTDHEVAHVHLAAPDDVPAARDILAGADGVDAVLDRAAQAEQGIAHENSGELVAVARSGRWFAYPWWTESRHAPDYASHVDIHSKPGFDPCELFFSLFPPGVCQDTGRVRGTHGRIGADRAIAMASTIALRPEPDNLVGLAARVQDWMAT